MLTPLRKKSVSYVRRIMPCRHTFITHSGVCRDLAGYRSAACFSPFSRRGWSEVRTLARRSRETRIEQTDLKKTRLVRKSA